MYLIFCSLISNAIGIVVLTQIVAIKEEEKVINLMQEGEDYAMDANTWRAEAGDEQVNYHQSSVNPVQSSVFGLSSKSTVQSSVFAQN